MTISGDLLLVATMDGALNAVDCRTGQLRWQQPGGGSEVPAATAGQGATLTVATAAGSEIRLLDSGGAEIWQRKLPDPAHRLLLTDDTVIVSDDQGRLHGLDRRTGSERWTTRFTDAANSLHLLGDMLLLRSRYQIDAVALDGRRLWSRPLGSEVGVDDGRTVWVADDDQASLLDARGTVTALGPVPPHQPGSWLFCDEGGLVLLDTVGVTRWGPA